MRVCATNAARETRSSGGILADTGTSLSAATIIAFKSLIYCMRFYTFSLKEKVS
jgi:hypothetical protein